MISVQAPACTENQGFPYMRDNKLLLRRTRLVLGHFVDSDGLNNTLSWGPVSEDRNGQTARQQ